MKIYYKIVSIFLIYSFEANHSESKTDTFLLNKNNDTPPSQIIGHIFEYLIIHSVNTVIVIILFSGRTYFKVNTST